MEEKALKTVLENEQKNTYSHSFYLKATNVANMQILLLSIIYIYIELGSPGLVDLVYGKIFFHLLHDSKYMYSEYAIPIHTL